MPELLPDAVDVDFSGVHLLLEATGSLGPIQALVILFEALLAMSWLTGWPDFTPGDD